MKKLFVLLSYCWSLHSGFGQQYFTRSGTVKAEINTTSQKLAATNYQSAATVDLTQGKLVIQALVKSFDINFRLADQLLNSTGPSSIPYPKIVYEGNFQPFQLQLGKEIEVPISGKLFAWNMERVTPTIARITLLPSGQIKATTELKIQVEPSTIEKLNELIQLYLPSLLAFQLDYLSLNPKINIQAQLNLIKK